MGKVFFIPSDTMGTGDDDLGRALMGNFLYSLARAEPKPERVMLANSGVRLTCEGSKSLDDLRLLEAAGVTVASCGTCLQHLGLAESLAVGQVGMMDGAVGAMLSSDEIVTIA